jgi:hypothetical protein
VGALGGGMLGVVQVRGSWRVNPADLWCAIGGELILPVTRLRVRGYLGHG